MFFPGWGTTSSGGYSSEILKFASLVVIDNANCSEQFEGTGYAITENMGLNSIHFSFLNKIFTKELTKSYTKRFNESVTGACLTFKIWFCEHFA